MLRRILLASIMLVAVLIVVYAVSRYALDDKSAVVEETPDEGAPPENVFYKYDENNNRVAEIRVEAFSGSQDGPVEMTRPVITLVKDKNNRTVIRADHGRVDSLRDKRMGNARLWGDVVMTLTEVKTGDNTTLTCKEMQYIGSKEKVVIPGDVEVTGGTTDLLGTGLTTDRAMGTARIEKNVHLVMKRVADDALKSLTRESASTPGGPAKEPTPVVITCAGQLLFHRTANRASFEREVVATQGEDSLRGDRMDIVFERRPVEPGKPEAGRKMAITRILMTSERAEGVTVTGPERKAWGDRFDYDAKTGLVVFSGAACRSEQTDAKGTYLVSGTEIRFGRAQVSGAGETLPEGMTETSSKMLVAGKPAQIERTEKSSGRRSILRGRRVLFEQETGLVAIDGDEEQAASAVQGGNLVTGRRIVLQQKSDTRPEKFLAWGPGTLEVERKGADGAGGPTKIAFGDRMTYEPEAKTVSLTGGVDLADRGTTSRSRTLSIEFVEGPGGDREIQGMVAEGDVVVKGDRSATGERLVYTWPLAGREDRIITITAKSGGEAAVKTPTLFWRAGRIHLVESPGAGGRTAVNARGDGVGFLQYQPGKDAEPFEVHYDKSGAFDDAKLEAEFDGNVRVRRSDMDLDCAHTTMKFVREKTVPEGATKAVEKLNLTTVNARGNVKVVMRRDTNPMTATGDRLVWERAKDFAELHGDSAAMARVVTDDSEVEAPTMVVFLKNGQVERVATQGGGRMRGGTRKRGDEKKGVKDLRVTWTDTADYRVFHPEDPRALSTAVAVIKGDTHATSDTGDSESDVLTVHFESEPTAPGEKGLRLEVRKVIAEDNVRAKMFMEDKQAWRYARGDYLEWDRVTDTMVVSSKTGEAMVWDAGGEWRGERLVVNRTREGRVEAESTSSRRIIFYEEGVPRTPPADAKEWKPIY